MECKCKIETGKVQNDCPNQMVWDSTKCCLSDVIKCDGCGTEDFSVYAQQGDQIYCRECA